MLSETARSCDGLKPPIDILRVTLLPNANTANNYQAVLWVNSVNDAMISELMLPVVSERPA